jgi:hypothetical protein
MVQCEEGAGVAELYGSCLWVRSEDPFCDVRSNSCEEISSKIKCETEEVVLNKACRWIVDGCHEDKSACEEINDITICEIDGMVREKMCVLVLDKCYDVKTSCDQISNSAVCKTFGAAKNVDNPDGLICFWLEGDLIVNDGKCVLRVLSSLIFFFFFFFFGC